LSCKQQYYAHREKPWKKSSQIPERNYAKHKTWDRQHKPISTKMWNMQLFKSFKNTDLNTNQYKWTAS
jgi:hypothetical protein